MSYTVKAEREGRVSSPSFVWNKFRTAAGRADGRARDPDQDQARPGRRPGHGDQGTNKVQTHWLANLRPNLRPDKVPLRWDKTGNRRDPRPPGLNLIGNLEPPSADPANQSGN